MQSQSVVITYCASPGLCNLALDSERTVGPKATAAASLGHCTLGKKVLEFSSPSKYSAPAAAWWLHRHFPQRPMNIVSAKDQRRIGGDTMPLVAEAAAENEAGGRSHKGRLESTDGLLIVDHGSRRAQSNAMLHEFVKMYKEETGHRVVEAAHMELAVPNIADGFDRCVEQGATRIIISPYFLFPGRHWDKDIPALAAEAAKKHPQVSYLVTAPIGLHRLMVTVINDRMGNCLSQIAGEVSECDMCKGSARCKQLTTQEPQLAASHTLASSIGNHSPP